ncbi:MAG: hypothetical protein AAF514_06095 [Verrucomicrobiota bacterium]
MDKALIEKAIERNAPFLIKTAGGDTYEVPHRDFISFSAKRTTVIVSYEENGEEKVADIPVLTISSVEASIHDVSS